MGRTAEQLRNDAVAIWQAGVDAVGSERLVRQAVRVEGGKIRFSGQAVVEGRKVERTFDVDLAGIGRIEVVGAGKAGSGMAAAFEDALRSAHENLLEKHAVSGWLNVPADCVRTLERIRLHPARPAGRNEPTPEGVAGSEEILRRVRSLSENDLCVVLLSGGGSALLPAPAEGVHWEDKLAVARGLAAAGASIRQLNLVRKQLSAVKGGSLARACRAGRLVTLVVSDVQGDPLDVIASGPTTPDASTPAEALAILEELDAASRGIPERVFHFLRKRIAEQAAAGTSGKSGESHSSGPRSQETLLIGTNAVAVEAAGAEAVRRGYEPRLEHAIHAEGEAVDVGRSLARQIQEAASTGRPVAIISGGEPTATLPPPERRGRGGRNQQLALAALQALLPAAAEGSPPKFALLSGGTDGEDGPTDAAGAVIDSDLAARVGGRPDLIASALERCDAYSYFDPLGALLKTGPTHTNVMDLRVAVVEGR